jgi:hypothetical protein
LEEDVPHQGCSLLKKVTLTESLIGPRKQKTWGSAEAQAMSYQSQRDDESRKKDEKVAFAWS